MNQISDQFDIEAPLSPKPSGYEFTPMQNPTIRTLAQRMRVIGIVYIIFAVFVGIGAFVVLLQSLPSALVGFLEVALFAFLGLWTYRGAASFQLIVDTKGSDISHLMNALDELRKIYSLQTWLMVAVLALMAIGIIVGVAARL